MRRSLPAERDEPVDRLLELGDRERLAEDRIRTRVPQRLEIRRAGDDSHRRPAGDELLEKGVGALVAEVHVQQNGVHAAGRNLLPRLREAPRLLHLVAAELEVHAAEEADRRLVVDDEHDPLRSPCRHKSAVYWGAVTAPARPSLTLWTWQTARATRESSCAGGT